MKNVVEIDSSSHRRRRNESAVNRSIRSHHRWCRTVVGNLGEFVNWKTHANVDVDLIWSKLNISLCRIWATKCNFNSIVCVLRDAHPQKTKFDQPQLTSGDSLTDVSKWHCISNVVQRDFNRIMGHLMHHSCASCIRCTSHRQTSNVKVDDRRPTNDHSQHSLSPSLWWRWWWDPMTLPLRFM